MRKLAVVITTLGASILLTACSPALQSNEEYQANYKIEQGTPLAQLSDDEICNTIQPPAGTTYASAVKEAQKRGLTRCMWGDYK